MFRFRLGAIVLVVILMAAILLVQHTTAQPPLPEDPFLRLQLPYLEPEGNVMNNATETADLQVRLPWSRVVYQTLRDGNWEIYTSQDDGTNLIRLTYNGTSDTGPRLNRGGTRIVYASQIGGDYDIFAMNSDGSSQVNLTGNNSNDVLPVWSPDGSRIAFQSYRDGQAEIYVMNSNGSGVTRLTNNPDFDGHPSWSPDGQKIAFVSYRPPYSDYNLYVMNSDGSGQLVLAPVPRSFYPAWSPDGSKIAFSCDDDFDNWLEICVMNSNGSGHHMIYSLPGTRDAWVSGWSPDGNFITFTEITFIYQSGAWYWTTAYGRAIDVNGLNSFSLNSDDTLWNPHWQTLDAIRPSSTMSPLAGISSYRITPNWSGNDAGGSGISGYDVQVMVGSNGVWTDWLIDTTETSAQYEGVSGQTYSFRARARDNARNVEAWPGSPEVVTTVETYPPRTATFPLPPFSSLAAGFEVHWSGSDPGHSGIQSYDVQYRVGTSAWQDWESNTEATSGFFYPDSSHTGHTLYFRSRARDYAGNQESWPADNGDSATTVYATAISGIVQDNSGTPIQGITLTTNPASFQVIDGDENGRYAGYLSTQPATFSAYWAKNEYGLLPTTTLARTAVVQLPIVLPPADNVVTNSGFETGAFEPAWLPGGSAEPLITSRVRHTGGFAARLSQGEEEFISGLTLDSGQSAQIVIDHNQGVHVIWSRYPQLIYMQRVDNAWLPPQVIAGTEIGGDDPRQLAVDDNNTLHLVWNHGPRLYYSQRPNGGSWSTPQIIQNNDFARFPVMHVTGAGIVHLVWVEEGDTYYKWRDSNGLWANSQNLSNSANAWSALPQLAVDAQGRVHVIWLEEREEGSGQYYYSDYFYTQKTAGGNWATPLNISHQNNSSSHSGQLAVEANGVVHVIWQQWRYPVDDNVNIYYTWRAQNGTWSTPYEVSENVPSGETKLSLDYEENLHLIFRQAYGAYHIMRSKIGSWSPAVAIEPVQGMPISVDNAIVDNSGRVHAVYHVEADPFYSQQASDGTWSPPRQLVGYQDQNWQMKVDSFGLAHIVWRSGDLSAYVKYAGPAWALEADSTSLSQVINIPITMTIPTLSFLYQGQALLNNTSSFLELTLDDGVSTTPIWYPTESNLSWRHQSVDLTPWVGQTVTITFHLEQTANAPLAWFYLDEVTLGAAHPDVWVTVSGANGLRHEEVTHTLSIGNRGGAIATSTRLAYTLPVDLIFVSASVPPVSISPLVWELGDLPAKSEPFLMEIVVQIASTAVGLSTINSTAVIYTSTELETLNNNAQGQTYIGTHTYLPIITR